MTTRERVFVALGSNLGNRDAHLAFGREQLDALPDTEVRAASAIEETAPIGPIAQPPYLNQMVILRTGLEPRQLLTEVLAIEEKTGRIRAARWGPRTLDIDIVRFGERTIDEPGLVVPHPEIANRPFWQREIEELESDAR